MHLINQQTFSEPSLWGLIFIVRLVRFRITMETPLWVCLWGCFQKVLAEKGKPTLNMDSAVPWACVLGCMERRKQAEYCIPRSVVPDCTMSPLSHTRHHTIPTKTGCVSLNCEPRLSFFKWLFTSNLSDQSNKKSHLDSICAPGGFGLSAGKPGIRALKLLTLSCLRCL